MQEQPLPSLWGPYTNSSLSCLKSSCVSCDGQEDKTGLDNLGGGLLCLLICLVAPVRRQVWTCHSIIWPGQECGAGWHCTITDSSPIAECPTLMDSPFPTSKSSNNFWEMLVNLVISLFISIQILYFQKYLIFSI